MPKLRVSMVVSLLILGAALTLIVGCAADEAETPAATFTSSPVPEPMETVGELPEELAAETPATVEEPDVTEEAEAQEPAQEPTPEPTAEPTVEPTATPVVVVDVDSACIECHTDADLLKSIAEEPEAVELSSGEG